MSNLPTILGSNSSMYLDDNHDGLTKPRMDSIGNSSASTMGLTADTLTPTATFETRKPNIDPKQQQQRKKSIVKFADSLMNIEEAVQRTDTEDDADGATTAITDRIIMSPSTDSKDTDDSSFTLSSRSTMSKAKFQSKHLRGNLTRRQSNRNPYTYYEVINVLGLGSMGSVAMVRKRPSAIGGSARKHNTIPSSTASASRSRNNNPNNQNNTPAVEPCFQFPMIGPIILWFHHTFRKTDGIITTSENENNDALSGVFDDPSLDDTESTPKRIITSSSSKSLNAFRNKNNNNNNSSTRSVEENSYDMTYAMKSIHISRCDDPTFVEELQNEIQILKTLDHPHIEKVIETFEYEAQIFVILELCNGGDLYQRDPYTEDEAARITSSILSAIAYMHSKNMYDCIYFMRLCFLDRAWMAHDD
jgi:Protein kinase domain